MPAPNLFLSAASLSSLLLRLFRIHRPDTAAMYWAKTFRRSAAPAVIFSAKLSANRWWLPMETSPDCWGGAFHSRGNTRLPNVWPLTRCLQQRRDSQNQLPRHQCFEWPHENLELSIHFLLQLSPSSQHPGPHLPAFFSSFHCWRWSR